jgi:dGTPase
VLERDGRGLNLTEEVRDGILRHTGAGDPATLEGKIVRLVDRVAYINHDIDDALRAGILSHGDLPHEELELLGETGARRIDRLVHDIVESSAEAEDIVQSDEIGRAMLNLRAFMFERVYLGPAARDQRDTATATVRRIFAHLVEHSEELPEGYPGDPSERVTDYIAGMTDRFALAWH